MSFERLLIRPKQTIYDILHDLVPYLQFRKCEKHQWRVLLLVKLQAFGLQLYEK